MDSRSLSSRCAVVDLGIGNIKSLRNSVLEISSEPEIVSDPQDLSRFDRVILPGVGNFSEASEVVRRNGWREEFLAFEQTERPIMGICLGMQLLADFGIEGGRCQGLGLIGGMVAPLADHGLRLPHVGWNSVTQLIKHPLFHGITDECDFYFNHRYAFEISNREQIGGVTEYGQLFPSVVVSGATCGVQFHPEKSQANGLRLLRNFLTVL